MVEHFVLNDLQQLTIATPLTAIIMSVIPAHASVAVVKAAVIKAAATFVPSHGFTLGALEMGTEQLLSSSEGPTKSLIFSLRHSLPSMFERGVPAALVEHYVRGSNNAAKQLLLSKYDARNGLANFDSPADVPCESLVVREALASKLTSLFPVIHVWPHAVRIESHPSNAPYALKSLAEFCDDVVFHTERLRSLRAYLESEQAVLQLSRGPNPLACRIRDLRKTNVGEAFPLSRGPHMAEGTLGIDWYVRRARICSAYLACMTCAVGESNGRPVTQAPHCMKLLSDLV